MDFAATLRAAAVEQQSRRAISPRNGLILTRNDLREPVRKAKPGRTLLICVDSSGSMAAQKRMAAVKAAAISLLLDAYRRRYRVGLVSFRGDLAEVLLKPTRSVDLAERRLRVLPTGGRTPLAAGIRTSAREIAAAAKREPNYVPLLVLLSDGRATSGAGDPVAEAMAAARQVANDRIASLVLDTEEGHVRLGLAMELARKLGATYLPLEHLDSGKISRAIQLSALQ
jgi:magnesium chelatase subunit D